jgi:hypothetical protein
MDGDPKGCACTTSGGPTPFRIAASMFLVVLPRRRKRCVA